MTTLKYRAILPLACLLLPACPVPEKVGDNPTTETTSEPTASDSTAAEPTTGPGTGDETTGEHVAVPCDTKLMTHAEACPSEPCAVLVDVEVRCEDTRFGDPGLRVAAGPTATWLVTASDNDAMLFTADGDGATRLDVLPASFSRGTIVLATTATGQLHAATTTMKGLLHIAEAGDWAPSTVTAESRPILDLAVDANDAAHVWFLSAVPDVLDVAVQAGDAWTTSAALAPADTYWGHFGLTSAGATVAVGLQPFGPGGENTRVRARIADLDRTIGSPFLLTYPIFRLAVAPGGRMEPSFAVATHYTQDIRVAWPTAADSDEISVPDTAMLAPICNSCEGPCHETAVGVERAAYALTRDDAGVGWLAYVTTHLDQELSYTEEEMDGAPVCITHVDSDSSTGVLHLLRVAFDGSAAVPVLTQPIAQPWLANLFGDDTLATPRAVDIRAHGSSLAIGVLTRAPDEAPAIRLLRIDTALLP